VSEGAYCHKAIAIEVLLLTMFHFKSDFKVPNPNETYVEFGTSLSVGN
jgi:hypothetical protein